MKTYESESLFVNNFAKDAKESIKVNGQNFEAAVNNINVIVTGMDNNNSSKVTVYSGTVNGVEFNGSITALKKRLNVTYTKEYARSAEGIKVLIKSDEELSRAADTATERIKSALNVLKQASQRYGLSMADMAKDSLRENVLAYLCNQRDKEALRRENEAKRKAEEAAMKEATKRRLLDDLAAASANGDMVEVMRLSKALKSYM